MKDEMRAVKALAVKPRFVTSQNSEVSTGEKFRFWKTNFPHLVRRVGRRDVIVADELEAAVQHAGGETNVVQLTAPVDPADAVRSILRRAGAH
jgi:hypothetical protein